MACFFVFIISNLLYIFLATTHMHVWKESSLLCHFLEISVPVHFKRGGGTVLLIKDH